MKDFGYRWLVIFYLMGLCLPGTAQYFRQVGSYSDGMAVVQEYRPNVGRMNNYGYVNEYNKLVIPMKYGYAGDFNKGLAIVGVGIKRGLINKSGKIVLPIIYDAASFLVSSESEVVVKVTKDGKDGVAGKNGIILPCQFSGVYGGYVEGDYRRKIIFAVFDDLSKIKLFELSGKPILPEGTYIHKYDQVITYDNSGTDYIYNTVSFRSLKDNKVGVFDMINRKVLVPPEYESVEPSRYGNYVVRKNNLRGMYNPDGDGKLIIPIQFDRIDSYGHENIIAYKGNEFAIYDYEGNEVVPFGCKKVGEYYLSDVKYHLIRRNGKYGALFVSGNQLVFDVVYDTIYKAEGGFISVNGEYSEPFIVKKDGKYGISAVFRSLKEAVFLSPEYDEVKFVLDKDSYGEKYYYLYKKDGLWGLTTSFSNIERNLPLAFDEIEESFDYSNQIDGFMVKRDGKWGYYKVYTDYRNNMELFDTKPQLLSLNNFFDKSNKLLIGRINGKYGISSLYGVVLIPFENDDIVGASDYCGVKKNGKWGLLQIDNSLSLTDYEQMEFIYDEIGRPSRFCPVRVKNKWGYCIDGKYAIEAKYDLASEFFINGRYWCALVRKGKKEFYIDSKGKKVK